MSVIPRIESEHAARLIRDGSGTGAIGTGWAAVPLSDISAAIATITSIIFCIIAVWSFFEGRRLKRERHNLDMEQAREKHLQAMSQSNYRLDEDRIIKKVHEVIMESKKD